MVSLGEVHLFIYYNFQGIYASVAPVLCIGCHVYVYNISKCYSCI